MTAPATAMRTTLLTPADVLAGYDAISALYPHIPPMTVWRGWEYAGYRRHRLAGPVLDVGCGDGQVFKLLWPELTGDVVGVDLDAGTVAAARASGVYRDVHQTAASEMGRVLPAGAFAGAFANCALEHMDDLPRVLANVAAALRPGGEFLFSVVTDKWRQWGGLALLMELAGDPDRAEALRLQHDRYHHHVNGLSVAGWADALAAAGFEAVEHTPIVPEVTGRLVSFLDQLWHLPSAASPTGEVGGQLHPILVGLPDFPAAFRLVVEGTMRMERDPATGGGAIFHARKR
ncbi:MAG: Methyltransferase type 11 [Phycisphaerales bacterium]|nr:Methyltransferase type 11 [Phycisphaerales bacterium]